MLRRIASGVAQAIANPRRAGRLARNRLFPLSIILNDPDAYQVVGSYTYGNLPRVELQDMFPEVEAVDLSICKPFCRESSTSLNAAELLILAALVQSTGAKKIVEVGTFNGVTTLNLAANSPPDAKITTIDLPPDWMGGLELEIDAQLENTTDRARVGIHYRDTEFSKKIEQVFCDSATLDWSTLDGPFDLAFIDGCHAYNYVVRDTENARSQLRPGGVIVWHDYGVIEDVARAVDDCAADLNPCAIRGTRIALAKIPLTIGHDRSR